ncbi:Pogo transposable element with, partial [Brachionus plicatilis]
CLEEFTTTGRDLPTDAINRIYEFFNNISNLISTYDLTDAQILNMDESAIYLDTPSSYTYSPKGAKRVKSNTCGSERTRLSTAFTGCADGSKLPILTIIPRKTEMPGFEPPQNVIPIYKTSSTFDDEVILTYINRVVLPRQQRHVGSWETIFQPFGHLLHLSF